MKRKLILLIPGLLLAGHVNAQLADVAPPEVSPVTEAPPLEAPSESSSAVAKTVLGPEFWAMPRHGETFINHQGVRERVNQLINEGGAYLAVAYPEGEMGELWGEELQAWLVALGISSDRIELNQSPDLLESVTLAVVQDGASEEAVVPEAEQNENALVSETNGEIVVPAEEVQSVSEGVVENP